MTYALSHNFTSKVIFRPRIDWIRLEPLSKHLLYIVTLFKNTNLNLLFSHLSGPIHTIPSNFRMREKSFNLKIVKPLCHLRGERMKFAREDYLLTIPKILILIKSILI